MSEIAKLYENVGIQKQYCGWLNIGDLDTNVQYVKCATKEKYDNYAALDSSDLVQIIPDEVYPPFTAEKQIELIKLLAKGEIKIDNTDGEYEFSIFDTISDFSSFEESLADLTNRTWQSLTSEEKVEIRRILE